MSDVVADVLAEWGVVPENVVPLSVFAFGWNRGVKTSSNDGSNNSLTSETIALALRPYNIRVAHKPIFTLRRLLTNVKEKDEPEDRPGAIYEIKRSDCQATYIGETGSNLTARLNEHKRATKMGDLKNNIA